MKTNPRALARKSRGGAAARLASSVASFALALTVLGVAATGANADPQQGATAQPKYTQLMLVAGDSVEVRFTTPFCSGNLKKDQVLDAEVASDKVISGYVAVKEGSPVRVRVVESSGNGFAGKAGRMKLQFESTLAADGATVPLSKGGPMEMKGKGKNIILKVLTLFIIHGSEPCVGTQDRFFPRIDQTTQVLVDPASRK